MMGTSLLCSVAQGFFSSSYLCTCSWTGIELWSPEAEYFSPSWVFGECFEHLILHFQSRSSFAQWSVSSVFCISNKELIFPKTFQCRSGISRWGFSCTRRCLGLLKTQNEDKKPDHFPFRACYWSWHPRQSSSGSVLSEE